MSGADVDRGLPGTSRLRRVQAPDFSGRPFSLPDSIGFWELLRGGELKDTLLLLGPGPGAIRHFASYARVFWLQAPGFPEAATENIPPDWERVRADKALEIAQKAQVYFYTPARRVAPAFWNPLVAAIRLGMFDGHCPEPDASVWLPGDSSALLHLDILDGLRAAGFKTVATEIAPAGEMARTWSARRPALAISVNFRGLDGNGDVFGLLRAMDVPLAVWLVDNPWNLLSGINLPWWKEADLFVTDASFVSPLRQYGASRVHFLPLAAPRHMRASGYMAGGCAPLFVGRSSFPEKNRFFAGVHVDPDRMARAMLMLAGSEAPDFHWWIEGAGDSLWPGKRARGFILGAENCSMLRRAVWLRQAAACGLRIAGDEDWRALAPEAPLQPPVDYYGALPQMYAGARCVLNVTSLLLPASLSQRHFDVWAAGGFLLSDATKGLEIFPEDLVKPVTLGSPDEFCERIAWFDARPHEKRNLACAWRQLILQNHLYEHRVREIMEKLAMG